MEIFRANLFSPCTHTQTDTSTHGSYKSYYFLMAEIEGLQRVSKL
jgi:hypothetical protein